MKKTILIIAAMVVLGGGFFLFSKPASESSDTTKQLAFSQVQTAEASGGQLLDVRTAEEYSAGHIESAINLSLQDIEAGTLPSIAKDQAIYVYCHSGNRSGQATAILKNAGYTNITDLGAITHVQEIGGKLVTN